MVWSIVCAILASLVAFVLTLRALMGDNDETRALKARLRFYRVEPRRFSTLCLTELIEIETRHLRLVETPTGEPMQSAIDKVAIAVRNICVGTQGFSAAELAGSVAEGRENPVWVVMSKHDPGGYGLTNLEKTQALNREIADAPE